MSGTRRAPSAGVVRRLRGAGCVFAEEEARLLSEAASGPALEVLVRRRVAGEPLEHLLGYVEFCGRRFVVEPGVFVPRQRSALLVEEAAGLDGTVVLDLCCGCGALGLAVRDRLGPRVELLAADLDPRAVDCARRNGVESASVGDLFDPVPSRLRGRVDLVLVNTPYVPTAAIADMPPESRDFEPRRALDGGPDGLDVQRRVLAVAPDWLSPTGRLLTETSTVQAAALARLARAAGLAPRIARNPELGATVLVAGRA
ncbi:MAG: putative protein N(5)-glutamine methyltransferase [Marmoricola sp.]